jgi:hypothetical protein
MNSSSTICLEVASCDWAIVEELNHVAQSSARPRGRLDSFKRIGLKGVMLSSEIDLFFLRTL